MNISINALDYSDYTLMLLRLTRSRRDKRILIDASHWSMRYDLYGRFTEPWRITAQFTSRICGNGSARYSMARETIYSLRLLHGRQRPSRVRVAAMQLQSRLSQLQSWRTMLRENRRTRTCVSDT